MWLNFVDTVFNSRPFEDVSGRGLVGIKPTTKKNLKEKNPTALNHIIWAANSDH